MAKEKTCGVYKIENLVDGKVYIGQSINVLNRLANHKSDLKHNRHHNTYLQHAYNKYGVENFDFSIICECDMQELDRLERYYIVEVYDSINRDKGYNRENGGNLYKIVSSETKEKISVAGKNRFKDPKELELNRQRAKRRFEDPEEHVKMSMAQKKRYEDPEERKKDADARLKFYSTDKGKQWIENYKNIMAEYWDDKNWRNSQREKSDYITIVQLRLDMTLVRTWYGVRQIAKELKGFYRVQLTECISNSYGLYGNGYKNFIWLTKEYYDSLTEIQINEYIDKYKDFNFEAVKKENRKIGHTKNRICQLDLNMNLEKIWDNAKQPSRDGFGFYSSSIRRCCNNQTKSYHGYIWMYENDYVKLQKESQQDSLLLCSNL